VPQHHLERRLTAHFRRCRSPETHLGSSRVAFHFFHIASRAPAKYLDRYKEIADERRRTYAAMMSAMDDAIGAVIQKLRDRNIEEQTLILFVNDNGGPPVNASSNGSLHGYKASTWEGGVRVPFLMQWKGRLPAGTVYDQPVIQMDLHATALAAAGIKDQQKPKLDGVDLLPYIDGRKKQPPHTRCCFGGSGRRWHVERFHVGTIRQSVEGFKRRIRTRTSGRAESRAATRPR
jgi:arylsulfatase A-like enzyme